MDGVYKLSGIEIKIKESKHSTYKTICKYIYLYIFLKDEALKVEGNRSMEAILVEKKMSIFQRALQYNSKNEVVKLIFHVLVSQQILINLGPDGFILGSLSPKA